MCVKKYAHTCDAHELIRVPHVTLTSGLFFLCLYLTSYPEEYLLELCMCSTGPSFVCLLVIQTLVLILSLAPLWFDLSLHWNSKSWQGVWPLSPGSSIINSYALSSIFTSLLGIEFMFVWHMLTDWTIAPVQTRWPCNIRGVLGIAEESQRNL